MQRIVGVLLAGGASTRFGGNKLAAQIDGCAIGLLSARTLAAVTSEIIVVVPPDRPATTTLFEREYPVSVCADARAGIGHSIAHGVAQSASADGWLIALADMPLIKIETVMAVKTALASRGTIVRPRSAGRYGHPVGFGGDFASELMDLRGDSGAASVIARHRDAVVTLDVVDPGILFDVDRPADLDEIAVTR